MRDIVERLREALLWEEENMELMEEAALTIEALRNGAVEARETEHLEAGNNGKPDAQADSVQRSGHGVADEAEQGSAG